MIIVSSCLAGIPCRYNAAHSEAAEVAALVKEGKAIPVCPECLAGLPVPRPSSEIVGGSGEDVLLGKAKVLAKTDAGLLDATDAFVYGAEAALEIALRVGAKVAVLKQNSPSCGAGSIYDGTFCGKKRIGNGVAAALLIKNGVEVISR
ncbi:MAG: DUF523 domain-containing protein [Clostridia bacterium]|nr:DUF523 domain-containing protein [Clostridia bacterium]